MTSDKQARANRRNALKSTGPKTPQGKAAVRPNALRHGLLSRDALLPGEDEHQEALSKAQEMRTKQDAETVTLGRTFIRDANEANAFSKLSRYETTIERSLFKALHDLQRL